MFDNIVLTTQEGLTKVSVAEVRDSDVNVKYLFNFRTGHSQAKYFVHNNMPRRLIGAEPCFSVYNRTKMFNQEYFAFRNV